ncbi:MAG: sigma-70 family RNA polymerase sigma factor [Muribaculaceae bacterium]|nr:sigma-70 family RNA polymerase sigma factor [Muribaculaceae bacterium]
MTEKEFKETVLPHHQLMLAEALRLLKNRDEALDCLQDAVTALWKSRKELTKVKNVKAYCMKIVYNRALEMIRQRKISDSEYGKNLQSDVTSDSGVEHKEKVAILRKALKLLPENEREVVMMKAINGMSGDEIAEATGLSTTNVRVLLHRGRKRIKDYMNKYYGL